MAVSTEFAAARKEPNVFQLAGLGLVTFMLVLVVGLVALNASGDFKHRTQSEALARVAASR